jgi:hypothetical protein
MAKAIRGEQSRLLQSLSSAGRCSQCFGGFLCTAHTCTVCTEKINNKNTCIAPSIGAKTPPGSSSCSPDPALAIGIAMLLHDSLWMDWPPKTKQINGHPKAQRTDLCVVKKLDVYPVIVEMIRSMDKVSVHLTVAYSRFTIITYVGWNVSRNV